MQHCYLPVHWNMQHYSWLVHLKDSEKQHYCLPARLFALDLQNCCLHIIDHIE
jgi:hypothetical protein